MKIIRTINGEEYEIELTYQEEEHFRLETYIDDVGYYLDEIIEEVPADIAFLKFHAKDIAIIAKEEHNRRYYDDGRWAEDVQDAIEKWRSQNENQKDC